MFKCINNNPKLKCPGHAHIFKGKITTNGEHKCHSKSTSEKACIKSNIFEKSSANLIFGAIIKDGAILICLRILRTFIYFKKRSQNGPLFYFICLRINKMPPF